jgi:hypothetical protein
MTTQGDGGTDRKRNDDDVLGRFSHCDVSTTPTNSLALALNSCRCSYTIRTTSQRLHTADIFDRSSVDSRPSRSSGRLLRPNDLRMRRKIAVGGHCSCSPRFLTGLLIVGPPPRCRRPRSRTNMAAFVQLAPATTAQQPQTVRTLHLV